MKDMSPPTADEIAQAASRVDGFAERTPVIDFDPDGRGEIAIKAECLQPTGSFKVRGAGNKILAAEDLPSLVYTASAGNMALAVAWHGARLGIPAAAVVPDSAPAAKTNGIERLGASVERVPFDEWWEAMLSGGQPAYAGGRFVHPFADAAVIAGNATIGLEIAEQAPDADAVVVPFGGGGLSLGIALGLRAAGSDIPVYAAEVGTASPFSLALAAGGPVEPEREPSFVDGIGGRAVFDDIWPYVKEELAGSEVVSIAETSDALRRVCGGTKLLLEGAGAAAVAAARRLRDRHERPVAVASGGNIDLDVAGRLLQGANP